MRMQSTGGSLNYAKGGAHDTISARDSQHSSKRKLRVSNKGSTVSIDQTTLFSVPEKLQDLVPKLEPLKNEEEMRTNVIRKQKRKAEEEIA